MSTQNNVHAALFPSEGWQTSEFWSQFFGVEDETFRKSVKEKKIPFSMWGNMMLVKAESIAAFLDNRSTANEKEDKTRKR